MWRSDLFDLLHESPSSACEAFNTFKHTSLVSIIVSPVSPNMQSNDMSMLKSPSYLVSYAFHYSVVLALC